ncbi:hypothetical protein MJO29_000778 [Puccinia striiformis f. sp. tritici]|nr:hypothetical protein MJO29_000778 [Puccinia striiformis f. sp. tritici]
MLASPLPSTDVKSDQTFSAEATIQQQQQHFATAATRRTSYSLYYHSTHEPDVYPEFNWEAHSTTHLSNMGDPLRSQSDDVDSKSHNSPLASALELHQTTGSASPQSSGSETLNSDGGTASLEMCLVRQAPHDASRTEEPLRVSNKRPRPSFSQLDRRCFERYRYAPEHSRSLSPSSADEKSLAPKKENDDDSCLPPIVTREEIERGVDSIDNNSVIQAPAAPLDRHKHDSTAIDALDNSSLRRPHGGIPSSLQSSSDVASFPVEHYISHPSSTHGTPATPHSATPISFSSHQSQPQHLHFSGHSHGYLSAVPSPLVPHSNGNDQSGVRSSYPGSPLMTLTAPNSATFPQEPNSSFSPLASQLHSAANQSQLGSPPSIHHRTPDAAYSQASASRVIRPYPSNGATQDVNAQILPGVPPSRLTASPAPQSAQASPWSSVETQAPRRRGKLPSAVTAILKGWLMAHTTHPYPTEEEKKSLCLETNLTMNQVSNWFINARRRILVPPSAGNSVHEVRQPIRRQAQSQLVRAAGNTGSVPPCLTIRHVGPQLLSPIPSTGLSMYSHIAASSPHLPNAGASFDSYYPISHHTAHGNHYHGEGLPVCRPTSSLSPCTSQWPHSTQLPRQSPTSPSFPSHGSQGALSYYSSAQSYQGYPSSHSSSSTPLPSPHFSSSFTSGPPHYSNPPAAARLHSPQPTPDSNPSTPTLSHSGSQHHSTPAYITHAPCHSSISYTANQDGDK